MANSKIFWPIYVTVVLAFVTLFSFMYKNFIFVTRDPLKEVYKPPVESVVQHGSVEDRVERQIPDLFVDLSTIAISNTPAKYDFLYRVYSSDNKIINDYTRETPVSFGAPYFYSSVEGITCFRGNNFNNTAAYGLVTVETGELEVAWSTNIGNIDDWTGVGWNGQPLIVKWDAEDLQGQNFKDKYKSAESLVEVIYGTLDGKVYFLDYETGEYTRTGTIDIGAPIKGTVTLDPRGYPILFVGQGDNLNGGSYVAFKFRIYSLVDFSLLHTINMEESIANRSWAASDATVKVDKDSDTAFICGENGLIYSLKLNSQFDEEEYTISIKPDTVKYFYEPLISGTYGIEATPGFFKNYMYIQDNNGTLQCIDVNTFEPLWVLDVTDDSDCALVLEVESDNSLALYTANEVDKQNKDGYSILRKIDAMTGEVLWSKYVYCSLDKAVTGGTLACPLVGKCNIDNLVYFSVARTDGTYRGRLYAMDKNSGAVVWSKDLPYYCWSSPTAVYTEDGKGYIIQCDSMGYMYFLDGETGETIYKLNLEANVEGSPAVYGNTIVVGTRGQKIYGVVIK